MSDVQQAAPQGQAAPAPAGAGQAQGAQGSFYSYEFPDGKEKIEAKSKEDLDRYLKDHYLRQKDYTVKTQTLAQFRKQVEQEREEMKKQREDLERKAREYTDYDWLVKNRPDVYKQLQRMATQVPSPDVAVERAQQYADEKYGELQKKLEDFDQWRQEQELQRQRTELLTRLRGEIPDYPDDDVVNETLEELGSGDLEKVLRFIYHANKGKQNPMEAEKRIAEAQQKKKGVKLMPSQGSAVEPKKSFKNLDEAANEYIKGLGG
jgi:SMC interacting uncharacterized protein involved in chromosome segregation